MLAGEAPAHFLVQFFTPDVCFADARKYLPALFAKRNLPASGAIAVLSELTNFIAAVDANLYEIYEVEAKQRIAVRDIDDWPIVAVSLMLNCPVWTEDADFFGQRVSAVRRRLTTTTGKPKACAEWLLGQAIEFTFIYPKGSKTYRMTMSSLENSIAVNTIFRI